MKYFLITLFALGWLIGCGDPPPETARASQQPSAILALVSTSTPSISTPEPTATPTSVPPSPTPKPPWHFVVLGDTRTAGLDPPEIMGQIVELARTQQPVVTLTVGDLINAMDDQASVREQWQRWRAAMAPLGTQATTPWMLVTPGNHDVQGHSWATTLMAEAFPELPDNGPEGLKPLTYRVDYQDVRFISIQTELFDDSHRLGNIQLAWLEDQLRNNPNRYTIVFGHDPAFPVGPHVGSALDVYPAERDAFWALLKQYQVTAYICGHEHLYNRQNIDGVLQLIVGTSGSFPYPGFGGDFYHYLAAEVTPNGISMAVYDNHGQERDRFVVP